MTPAEGKNPSVQFGNEQKLYSTVSFGATASVCADTSVWASAVAAVMISKADASTTAPPGIELEWKCMAPPEIIEAFLGVSATKSWYATVGLSTLNGVGRFYCEEDHPEV
jgi:hypothetical protein